MGQKYYRQEWRVDSRARCVECGRVFDLMDEVDADEWFYGHDCEVQ
jgi:hypothetical protein